MSAHNVLYLCKNCNAFYDGFAQCCMELNHIAYEVDENNQIIKEFQSETNSENYNESNNESDSENENGNENENESACKSNSSSGIIFVNDLLEEKDDFKNYYERDSSISQKYSHDKSKYYSE